WPWQVGQLIGREPASAPLPLHTSQDARVGTRTVVCLPLKASSSVISRLKRRSLPRRLAPWRPPAAPATAALEGGVAEAVIGRALLIVLQDVIGLADVLETLLGLLVARIAVR